MTRVTADLGDCRSAALPLYGLGPMPDDDDALGGDADGRAVARVAVILPLIG